MKKAQVKMMETVMILMVFFIIVVIGFIFYSRIQTSSIQQMQRQRFEEESVAISQNILYMPELQCSEKSVMNDICFDIYKIEALSKMVDPSIPENRRNFLFYQKEFGNSKISIRKIFPGDSTTYKIYDNSPVSTERRSSIKTSLPVSLKDATKRYGQYSIGILDVEVYT